MTIKHLGLACYAYAVFCLTPQIQSAELDQSMAPLRINFIFRFDVKSGIHAIPKPAPWYAYFPQDPSSMGGLAPSFTGQQFPNWPNPFPPAAPSGPTPSGPEILNYPKKISYAPQGYNPYSNFAQQPNYSTPWIQPVSLTNGVPSYWYGR